MNIHPYQPQWCEKAKEAMREKAESGVMPGCAPLGYRNMVSREGRYIEPDPSSQQGVRGLFFLVDQGWSIRAAGEKVAATLGLVSRNGKALNPSSIHAILTNPFYIGMLRYEGKTIQGKHQALVSKELFDQVQEKLARKGRRRT